MQFRCGHMHLWFIMPLEAIVDMTCDTRSMIIAYRRPLLYSKESIISQALKVQKSKRLMVPLALHVCNPPTSSSPHPQRKPLLLLLQRGTTSPTPHCSPRTPPLRHRAQQVDIIHRRSRRQGRGRRRRALAAVTLISRTRGHGRRFRLARFHGRIPDQRRLGRTRRVRHGGLRAAMSGVLPSVPARRGRGGGRGWRKVP